jgi:hypothetical protein
MAASLTGAPPLSLDSTRWGELRQRYGGAEDVPRLLAALPSIDDPSARAELWFALWRMLCQPDAVFTAAYAAVPHLLAIAEPYPLRERSEGIQLVCRIELLRRAPGAPPIPGDLIEAYAAAIERMPAIVAASVGEPWDADVAQILAAALLIGKRQGEVGAKVLGEQSER